MYVTRDQAGNINGAFALPQSSFPTERVADDDPDLLAFKNPPPTPIGDKVRATLGADPTLAAMVRKFAKVAGETEKDMIDGIVAEVKIQALEG